MSSLIRPAVISKAISSGGVAAVVFLVSLMWATPAPAASVVIAQGKDRFEDTVDVVTVTAGPGEVNAIALEREGDRLTVTDTGPPPQAGSGCAAAGEHAVVCETESKEVRIALGDGDDRIDLLAVAARVDGGPGADRLLGSSGRDVLEGGGGPDLVQAGRGRDRIVDRETSSGESDDVVDAGPGRDTVDYSHRSSSVDVDLAAGVFGGEGERDAVTAVEVVATGSGDDTLRGGAGSDSLNGGGGQNLVEGGAGDDRLRGSGRLVGGDGRDVLECTLDPSTCTATGGTGDDELLGVYHWHEGTMRSDDDRLDGGTGDDRLVGYGGNDVLVGGAGDDRLAGDHPYPGPEFTGYYEELHWRSVVVDATRAGRDLLTGGLGDDRLFGGGGTDDLSGGRGRDTLISRDPLGETVGCGSGVDAVRADGRDRLRGCERSDTGYAPHIEDPSAGIFDGELYVGAVLACPRHADGPCRGRMTILRTDGRRVAGAIWGEYPGGIADAAVRVPRSLAGSVFLIRVTSHDRAGRGRTVTRRALFRRSPEQGVRSRYGPGTRQGRRETS